LGWLLESGDADRAWELAANLCSFWYLHLRPGEGRRWLLLAVRNDVARRTEIATWALVSLLNASS
jgi:hypothetical protein